MLNLLLHKIQDVLRISLSTLFLCGLLFCQNSWALQSAIVVSDKAIIYADNQMSAAVGFVQKGKKLQVGKEPQNKGQVFPIFVSGKIAYIRAIDITTQIEGVNSNNLIAQRFKKNTQDEHKQNYSLGLFNYSSQVSMKKNNSGIKDKDAVEWWGASLRGGAMFSERWDLDIVLNFLNAKAEDEVFRSVEFGFGVAYHVIQTKKFSLKLMAQAFAVPFASYSLGTKFRVNGYGFTLGPGLRATYLLGKNWGLEGYGGFYYSKISGMDVPSPYNSISPVFMGTRLGLGLNYQY